MNQNIKAIIFDLDGTLVHTTVEYRYKTVSSIMKHFKKELEMNEIDRFWFGNDRNKIISSWGVEPKEFWKFFREYDIIEMRERYIHPYNDCWILKKLKEKVKLGLITNTPRKIAEMELKKLDVEFDAVVFAQEKEPKPHPSSVLECLEILDVSKDEAIMVGNSEEDIIVAQNIGIKYFIIDRSEYEITINPLNRINSLDELLKAVK